MSLLNWFAPPHFEQEDQRRRARTLYTILVAIFGFEIVFVFLIPVFFPANSLKALSFLGGVIAYTLICYILLHRGKLWLSSFLFCILLGMTTLGASLESKGLDSFTLQVFTIVILIIGLLLGARYSFVFAVMGTASVILQFIAESTGVISTSQTTIPVFVKIAIPSFVFLMAAILLNIITQNLSTALRQARENEKNLESVNLELSTIQSTLQERISQRTAQLQATVEISQTMSFILDPDQLGQQIIHKLSTLFEYDFAAIYLLDPTEKWALLTYSNPTASQDAQVDVVRLDITKTNSVANAIRTRNTQITNLQTAFSQPPGPHLLPNIHTEIVLPLVSRGRTLGAISLQSTKTLSISSEEMALLESISSQIAAAFENARLFNETQQQLDEINRLNQLYLQTTWRAMLAQKFPAYQFSKGHVSELDQPNQKVLEMAQQARKVTIYNDPGRSTLVAPILFQNQVLGALELTLENRTWTTDEVVLVEAVLSQTARSLENTRLILETRNRAEQEKMIGDISSRIRETLDLETILQTGVQEMQRGLKLSEVEIRLLPSPAQVNSDYEHIRVETGE